MVDGIIELLKKEFGNVTYSRGKQHDFLGMDVSFTENKTVSIHMKNQIEEAIDWLNEDIPQNASTPANKKLFTIEHNSPELVEIKADKFHSIVAKLLYVSKRARPDIEPTIAYLCTRVSQPTENDWKKLRRVLSYLKGTIEDKRIIGAPKLNSLVTWVDAAYAVYENMRSQTGGAMSFGLGLVHGRSSKQKLNTKSSTEAEVVGVSEYLTYNI